MTDKRDFVCTVCQFPYFWIKQWNPNEPGWYVLCGNCKELYELSADGSTKRIAFLETN